MSDTETKNAEADAYVERVLSDMPEFLSDAHIVRIIGSIVTAYVPDVIDAARLLMTTLELAAKYHDEVLAADNDCMCTTCVRERKESAH